MKIEIYGKSTCAYCARTTSLLSEKGLKYEYSNVELNENKLIEMKTRTNGATTVPQIFINDELIGGYDDLRKFFKNKNI